jgi:hypothetical protein
MERQWGLKQTFNCSMVKLSLSIKKKIGADEGAIKGARRCSSPIQVLTEVEVKQRRPRLVLGWVTARKDRTPQTWVRLSVWTLNCDRPTLNTLVVTSVVKLTN